MVILRFQTLLQSYLSRPKTHSKGVTVISHLKPEGLKCNLTQTIIL